MHTRQARAGRARRLAALAPFGTRCPVSTSEHGRGVRHMHEPACRGTGASAGMGPARRPRLSGARLQAPARALVARAPGRLLARL